MNRSQPKRPCRRRPGGFTLVELLVAMAVTLILIFALAQAFAIVGDSVAKGRASIEMAGNLRVVANLLQKDLQGITVPVRPWADDVAGDGYFEILDGPSTDKDWNYDGAYDINPAASNTTYGDIDDVIAFTTRSAEAPFFGTAYRPIAPYTWGTYRSTLAEVVWWIQFQDLNDDGIRNADEPFVIHRRAMMIRPDLRDLPIRQLSLAANQTTNADNSITFTFADGVTLTKYTDGRIIAAYPNDATGYAALKTDLFDFYNNNDVSVRLVWTAPSKVNVRLACNSLADLTKRESRFAHVAILADRPALALAPVAAAGGYPALLGPVFPFLLDTNRRSVTSLYRNPKFGANQGEDVMVSDALAFDVQVFDPWAPLLNWDTGDALVPSDPAYFPTTWTPTMRPPTNTASIPYTIGLGAFVDLGYGSRFHNNASNWSLFSGRPTLKSRLYVPPNTYLFYDYCTWSKHYESNGVDEDSWQGPDQGTNGFDDPNYVFGVDDVADNLYDYTNNQLIRRGENETLPPYPVPLRGIQIRIRVWDPDSRQVRQATVVSDFVPE